MSAIAEEAVAPILQQWPENPRPDCDLLWRTFHDAVAHFAEYNDRLADFVVELQKLQNADNFFKDMPQFNNFLTEFQYGSTVALSLRTIDSG